MSIAHSHSRTAPGLTNAQFGKVLVFANALVPLAMLLLDIYLRNTGADRVAYIEHTTGIMALVCLVLSLAVTPLRKITGNSFYMHFRRMLGLFAFFYAVLHVLAYLQYQTRWDIPRVIYDLLHQRYIIFGMIGFVLLIPLALTSTSASVKRLGAVNWRRLHKLVYITAICAVLHFFLLVKADTRLPWMFATVLAVLFALRIIWAITGSRKKNRRPVPPSVKPA